MFGKLGDVAGLMRQAGAMRENIERAREAIESAEFAGASPGGEVEVVVGGDFTIRSVRIEPRAMETEGGEDLAQAFMTAVNDAVVKVKEHAKNEMSRVTGGLDLSNLINP